MAVPTLPLTYISGAQAHDILKGTSPFSAFLSKGSVFPDQTLNDECSICLTPMNPTNPDSAPLGNMGYSGHFILQPTVCTHHFHLGCLRALCDRNDKHCPLCRRTIFPGPTDELMYEIYLDFLSGEYEHATILTELPIQIDGPALQGLTLYAAYACYMMPSAQPGVFLYPVARGWEGRTMIGAVFHAVRKVSGRRRTIKYLREYLVEEAEYETSLQMSVSKDMMDFAEDVVKMAIHCYFTHAPNGIAPA